MTLRALFAPRLAASFVAAALVALVAGASDARAQADADAPPPRTDPAALAAAYLDNLVMVDFTNLDSSPSDGVVLVKALPDNAPRHVARIKRLAREGYYDGVTFHRVIDGFMAQGGDPSGTGRGTSPYGGIRAEFSPRMRFQRGTAGMARTSDPNGAFTQFTLFYEPAPWLDNQYSIWGHIVEGQRVADALPKGEPPASPGVMRRVRVMGDLVRASNK